MTGTKVDKLPTASEDTALSGMSADLSLWLLRFLGLPFSLLAALAFATGFALSGKTHADADCLIPKKKWMDLALCKGRSSPLSCHGNL